MERRLLFVPLMLLCLLAPKVLADDDDGDGIDWGVGILSVESEDDGTEVEIGEVEILGVEATVLEFETGDDTDLTIGEVSVEFPFDLLDATMLSCGAAEDGGYLSVADVTVLDFLWVRALYWGGEHQGLAETSLISAYSAGDGSHCLLPITIGDWEGSLFSHSSDGFQLLYVINIGGGD